MPAACKNVTDAIAALDKGSDAVVKLDVKYGAEGIPQPGARLANKTVVDAPTLSAAGLDFNKRYLLTLLDLDPPIVSFPVMGPILHWLQPDMTVSSSSFTLSSTAKPIWPYRGAGPPPFSAPHRYVFLLYEQPASFDAGSFRPPADKENAVWPRVRWDHVAFEKKAGLGGVVASNYFVAGST